MFTYFSYFFSLPRFFHHHHHSWQYEKNKIRLIKVKCRKHNCFYFPSLIIFISAISISDVVYVFIFILFAFFLLFSLCNIQLWSPCFFATYEHFNSETLNECTKRLQISSISSDAVVSYMSLVFHQFFSILPTKWNHCVDWYTWYYFVVVVVFFFFSLYL